MTLRSLRCFVSGIRLLQRVPVDNPAAAHIIDGITHEEDGGVPFPEDVLTGQPQLEMQVIGSSLDEIKEALSVAGSLRTGSETPLAEGATLKVQDVSKSSGFEATTVILTAVITIATSTTSELLLEWLKSRLFKGDRKPSVTILIDGKELQVRSGS